MARFTITLPEKVASRLADDEGQLKTPRSTLIAQYLEQHYTEKSAAEYEEALQELTQRAQEAEEQTQECKERAEKLAGELKEAETQRQVERENLEKQREEAEVQLHEYKKLVDVRAAAAANYETQLRGCKEQSAADMASKNIVISGLQNELESAKTQTKNLDDKLVIYSGIINDLKADKENLQKQLELVTLRLPAPRVGFWARLRRKSKE